MEETVTNSTRSSDNEHREISYLFGRDPSILAYGQQSSTSNFNMVGKILYPLYETKSDVSDEKNSTSFIESTIKVYLRMKPFPVKYELTGENLNAYKILNATTLLTKLPTIDKSTNMSTKRSKSSDMVCRRFTFTQTFEANVTQLEIFECAVKPQMADLLTGKSSVVMSYGTTNAGKSYTLQGTCSSPGIIPRSLEYVFSRIIPDSIPYYKIINNCNVVGLSSLERMQESDLKNSILLSNSNEKSQFINDYRKMQCILEKETTKNLNQHDDVRYSIWVSFAEIYNETIHDLLSNDHTKKNSSLKISTDYQGKAFIKDLTTVFVQSGAEAYQILLAGQYNLKVAATALNARSSRSHCIFTIKLLRYRDGDDPSSVQVSTFSFCDLAGSERLKKTLNIGDRLKEAQNINTSLLVLGRCLKSIYDGQMMKSRTDNIGPFRESKLTRLFQNALSGKENLALIVNINPLPNFYNETLNVLKFCAIAKKIVIEPKQKIRKKRSSRFSSIVSQSIKTVTDWDIEIQRETSDDEIEIENSQYEDPYQELLMENKKLKREIVSLNNALFKKDVEIRNEMADNYSIMIEQIETDWKNRVKDVEKEQESMLEFKIHQLKSFYDKQIRELETSKKHKRPRSSMLETDDEENNVFQIEELKIRNEDLLLEIDHLKNINKKIRQGYQVVCGEKNEIQYELELVKRDYQRAKNLQAIVQINNDDDIDLKKCIQELESQLSESRQQEKKLKEYLNEAKEEYVTLSADIERKDQQLQMQQQIIIENEDKIVDLETNLEDNNICLSEQIKRVELQEYEIESQNNRIITMTEEIQNLKLHIKNLKGLKPTGSEMNISITGKAIKFENDVVIKQESINDMQDNGETEPVSDNVPTLSNVNNEQTCDIVEENMQLKRENESSILKVRSLEKCLEMAQTELAILKGNIQNSKPQTKDMEVSTIGIPCKEVECQVNDSFKEKKVYEQHYVQTNIAWDDNLREINCLKTKCDDLENQHLRDIETEKTLGRKIRELEEEISTTKNQSNNFMEVYLKDILKSHSEVTEFQKGKINDLNENIKIRQMEIDELKQQIDQNNEKFTNTEKQLIAAISREKEKDNEINNLQKELKNAIQKNTTNEFSDKQMELQLKDNLKELNQAKEIISQKDGNLFSLKERLRTIEIENNELKRALEEKEHEFDTFKKHRDDTLEKYDNLVKEKQNQLEIKTRDLMKCQEMLATPSISVLETPNTEERRKIRTRIHNSRSKKKESCKTKDNESMVTANDDVEVSVSESKRSIRHTTLRSQNNELKKSTRKKKLFTAKDDSFIDLEPLENDTMISSISNPQLSTRSLRARKK